MIKSIRVICLLFWVLASLSAKAFSETAATTLKLETLFSETKSLEANFKQVVSDPSHKTIRTVFSGTMSLAKPGRFRWFIQKPNQQLILINQDALSIYDVDLEQVSIRKLNQKDKLAPAYFLTSSALNLKKYFLIRPLPQIGTQLGFELKPLLKESLYESIQIYFDKHQALQRLVFADSLGQMTDIYFSDVKLNRQLPETLFSLKIPKGVDVFKE